MLRSFLILFASLLGAGFHAEYALAALEGFGGRSVQSNLVPVTEYPFSVLAYARVTNSGANRTVSKFHVGSTDEVKLYIHSTNRPILENSAGDVSEFTVHEEQLQIGVWHPVAIVNESPTVRSVHYWDAIGGNRTSLTGRTTYVDFPESPVWRIGDTSSVNHPIQVAEVAAINRALSLDELDEWSQGWRPIHVPSFADDIVGYQPLETGVNNDGYIGPEFFEIIGPNWVDHPTLLEPPSPGDFDHDGIIDGHDFLLWQRGGSPNGIGTGDLAEWQSNFGTSGSVTAIPESGTGILMCLVGVVLLSIRRHGEETRRNRNTR